MAECLMLRPAEPRYSRRTAAMACSSRSQRVVERNPDNDQFKTSRAPSPLTYSLQRSAAVPRSHLTDPATAATERPDGADVVGQDPLVPRPRQRLRLEAQGP